jgi:hypothetical protein
MNDIEDLHRIACENKESMFLNPETKMYTMTSYYLGSRGKCCTSGCKYCPYKNGNLNKYNKYINMSEQKLKNAEHACGEMRKTILKLEEEVFLLKSTNKEQLSYIHKYKKSFSIWNDVVSGVFFISFVGGSYWFLTGKQLNELF